MLHVLRPRHARLLVHDDVVGDPRADGRHAAAPRNAGLRQNEHFRAVVLVDESEPALELGHGARLPLAGDLVRLRRRGLPIALGRGPRRPRQAVLGLHVIRPRLARLLVDDHGIAHPRADRGEVAAPRNARLRQDEHFHAVVLIDKAEVALDLGDRAMLPRRPRLATGQRGQRRSGPGLRSLPLPRRGGGPARGGGGGALHVLGARHAGLLVRHDIVAEPRPDGGEAAAGARLGQHEHLGAVFLLDEAELLLGLRQRAGQPVRGPPGAYALRPLPTSGRPPLAGRRPFGLHIIGPRLPRLVVDDHGVADPRANGGEVTGPILATLRQDEHLHTIVLVDEAEVALDFRNRPVLPPPGAPSAPRRRRRTPGARPHDAAADGARIPRGARAPWGRCRPTAVDGTGRRRLTLLGRRGNSSSLPLRRRAPLGPRAALPLGARAV
mmetsp:Transcript_22784/g.65518  ORF Transcript_22784/g.65518 Transcript_22784/m.65518 type:complete len:439 (-) Transcript_22784:447-1763(-)